MRSVGKGWGVSCGSSSNGGGGNSSGLCHQTVSHCKSLIEKDDATRKELGLEILSFSELRQYKKIRDCINEDAIWLPGKRISGGMDRRSFVDEDEEDERYDAPLILFTGRCRVGLRCLQFIILPTATVVVCCRTHPLLKLALIGHGGWCKMRQPTSLLQ